MEKTKVGIIFGGKSAEHEISLLSASNIIDAIDKEKYEVCPIAIDKDGKWYSNPSAEKLIDRSGEKVYKLILNDPETVPVVLSPNGQPGEIINSKTGEPVAKVDVVFPVMHGPMGEDGTIQGLFKLFGVPFVGPSILGSAVAMDKVVMKRLFKEADIPTPKFLVFQADEKDSIDFAKVENDLGMPVFVKPANMGSSIGIDKAKDGEEFAMAVETAFKFDRKIVIEEFIDGQEIECAVLGNEEPKASDPGELKINAEFYSYDAKYIDKNSAEIIIPAELPDETKSKVKELAVRAFQACDCEGMARCDFFVRGNEVFVSELNTIPGFTNISMYPKMWEQSGIGYSDLIDKLIQLALDRAKKEAELQTSYE